MPLSSRISPKQQHLRRLSSSTLHCIYIASGTSQASLQLISLSFSPFWLSYRCHYVGEGWKSWGWQLTGTGLSAVTLPSAS
ncbi:uncharacterized protein TrAtP1_005155 [Trichoderma atroviride]|uniref:uncharacterized protein n=1 Tax=Hypocrea atroviridis TaxID=63577 RepID=UPI003333CC68|nr:hypothetical protein TrAtP1_005155 [Trichoderma atroviride]